MHRVKWNIVYRPSDKLNRDKIRTVIDIDDLASLANNNGVNITCKVIEDKTYYWNSNGYKIRFILVLKGQYITEQTVHMLKLLI